MVIERPKVLENPAAEKARIDLGRIGQVQRRHGVFLLQGVEPHVEPASVAGIAQEARFPGDDLRRRLRTEGRRHRRQRPRLQPIVAVQQQFGQVGTVNGAEEILKRGRAVADPDDDGVQMYRSSRWCTP